jgi:hypothetical protein
MGDALFHRDRDKVALFLLSDHLVELTDMHRVEDWLADGDLSRGLDVHSLLDSETQPFVLCRVCAVYAERV